MRYDLLHPKALRAALIEHMGEDYPVPQERQVRRWISGDTPMPGWAKRAVDEIHGIRKDALPSEWEGRFEKVWGLLVATAIASGVELETVEEMQRELAASLRSPLPDAQRQTEDAHSRDG